MKKSNKNKMNKFDLLTERSQDTYGFNVQTTAMNEGRKLKWISKLPLHMTLGVASVSILLSVGISFYNNDRLDENRQKMQYISQLKIESENLNKNIPNISKGQKDIFNNIRNSNKNIETLLNTLKNGGSINDENFVSPISDEMLQQFDLIINDWKKLENMSNNILKQEDGIINIVNKIKINEQTINALIDSTSDFNKTLKNRRNTDSDFSQELYNLSNRIGQNIKDISEAHTTTVEKTYLLIKDIKQFNELINAFKNGSKTLGINQTNNQLESFFLTAIERNFQAFKPLLENTSQIQALSNINQTIVAVLDTNKVLFENINNLDKSYSHKLNTLNTYNYLTIFLFIIGIAGLALFILYSIDKEKRIGNAAKELQKNQNNQAAVNLLLEQINPMDAGDFTKRVYVSDRFVTQIAEKIDKTRERIGNIVKKIKNTGSSIENNAAIIDDTSKKLLETSDSQFNEIQKLNDKIEEITTDMDNLAQNIWVALKESNESTQASQNGVKLIDQSTSKMEQIRNNIQESSKKIKKSSESAQAITEVTGLIQNITKKIEVLALNAAIQAASSGESGREFTVVAQEVQRLAIDSKEATKQILELVKEVQEDINVSVASMEKTTKEVVDGTKLTDNAGQALKKIEELSGNTSTKVEDVSEKLMAKSSEMAEISSKMKDLQNTTEKSKEIVKTMAGQVDGLKKISQELNNIIQNHKVE